MLLPKMISSGRCFVDDPAGRLHVDLVGILRQDRKVHDGGLFRPRIDADEIVEGAHRLGAQVAAPDDVVVQDRADPPGFRLPVAPVQIIDQGAEDHGIGHLAADHPGLDLPAAQVAGHLLLQQLLHAFDEIRSLVVEDLRIVVGSEGAVLGIAEGGIHASTGAAPSARPSVRRG